MALQSTSRDLVPLNEEDDLESEHNERRVSEVPKKTTVRRREEGERPIASKIRTFAKGAYGAVNVVFVPWRFAMNDEYYNSLHVDPNTRSAQQEYREKKKRNTTAQVTRRNTSYSVGCAAGCSRSVNINYVNYDPFDSDYLVCSETCTRPVAAHKECIRKSMASTGIGRYSHGCGECGGEMRMTGRFRLGFWEIPYTVMAILRHCLKHYLFMPMIFCQVWYIILWIQAWLHYSRGKIEERPANPFTLHYVMYSATDPTWTWEAHTFRQKWFTGFTLYVLLLPFWWLVLSHVWNYVKARIYRVLYRYEV